MTEFFLPLRVYIEDTDAGGIVYYVNYLRFMERARTEFMRSLGYGKTAVFDEDAMFVVASLEARYLAPARLDDELRVSAKPVKAGHASIVFAQRVLRSDTTLCEANVRIACVSRTKGTACAMPAVMHERVQAALRETQPSPRNAM